MKSWQILRAVLSTPVGSPTRKMVLVVLAEHTNEQGRAWPSVATIATEGDLGTTAVRAALADLRRDGLIVVSSRATQHRPTEYRIDLDALAALRQALPSDPDLRQVLPSDPDLHVAEVCQPATSPPDLHVAEVSDVQGNTWRHPDLRQALPNSSGTSVEHLAGGGVVVGEGYGEGVANDDRRPLSSAVRDAWEKSTKGPTTGGIRDDLQALVDKAGYHALSLPEDICAGANLTGEEWVIAAIEEARASSDGRGINVRFVQRILERWMAEGFESVRARHTNGAHRRDASDAIREWGDRERAERGEPAGLRGEA